MKDTVTLTVIGYSRDLLHQWYMCLSRLADLVVQVTYCFARAAVDVIAAAHGLKIIKVQV